jgi:hypothetical protein
MNAILPRFDINSVTPDYFPKAFLTYFKSLNPSEVLLLMKDGFARHKGHPRVHISMDTFGRWRNHGEFYEACAATCTIAEMLSMDVIDLAGFGKQFDFRANHQIYCALDDLRSGDFRPLGYYIGHNLDLFNGRFVIISEESYYEKLDIIDALIYEMQVLEAKSSSVPAPAFSTQTLPTVTVHASNIPGYSL